MKLNREDLLRKLEAVTPGLAVREAIEQSSCLVFKNERLLTFNDEVACSIPCDLGFEGAVVAAPLLALLSKMTEKDVNISVNDKGTGLVVKGKRKRATITMESEVSLPVDAVEIPDEWEAPGAEFADAVGVVQHCASKDPNTFSLTCIHITPDYVEACDNYQLARYPVHTGVSESCLVKRDSLRHVTGLGMSKVCATKNWLHWLNPTTGLVLSARREFDEYEDLSELFIMDNGTPTTLPGGLAEACEKAAIFSEDNADDNVVLVKIKAGKLSLRGKGASGWYEEQKSVKYSGPPVIFSMAPDLLIDIIARTNDCLLDENRLKIDGGKFEFVTCLGEAEPND